MTVLFKRARLVFICFSLILALFHSVAVASVKAVIFDCDGVLVDTEYLKFEAWREALAKHNINFTIEDYLPLVGHSSEKIASEIEKQKNAHFDQKIVISEKNVFYKARQAQGVPPIPEAVTFLKSILENKAKYNIKLGLASSAPHAEINRNLSSIGVNPKDFDAIASGDDDLKHIVDPEGTNKPKPYIYQIIAKSLSVVPEECIVFEDTNAGVEAAATAGMKAYAVPNKFTEKQDFKKAVQVLPSLSNFDIKAILQNKGQSLTMRYNIVLVPEDRSPFVNFAQANYY